MIDFVIGKLIKPAILTLYLRFNLLLSLGKGVWRCIPPAIWNTHSESHRQPVPHQ